MTLPIDSSLLPADVRQGGAQARKLYGAALEFEKLLTTQLAQSLTSALTGTSGEDGDDGHDDGDGVTSGLSSGSAQLASQLPAQLADAIAQSGGLGLAPKIYAALKASQGGAADDTAASPYAGLDAEAQARVAAAAGVAGGSR